jgi:hypothetical protein
MSGNGRPICFGVFELDLRAGELHPFLHRTHRRRHGATRLALRRRDSERGWSGHRGLLTLTPTQVRREIDRLRFSH